METKNKRGFTLVELLVVIAIIGILSTVAVVNLNSSRKKAKETAALQAISSYTTAAILCDHENSLLRPPLSGPNYVGGDVCQSAININWPDPGDLPEGYDIIFTIDTFVGDGFWTYALFDIEGEFRTIVCDNDTTNVYDEGCNIQ